MRQRESRPGTALREYAFGFFGLICLGILAFEVVSRFSIFSVWDDAYFFVRYADHWLTDGRIAWDPAGPPAYGVTSLLFLAVVTPLRWLVRDNPVLPAALASLLPGLVFLGLLFALIRRAVPGIPWARRIALGAVLLSLAGSTRQLATHFDSGMDTTFVMAYVTLYLLLLEWRERARSRVSTMIVGLYGGMALWVRPDVLLYTFLVPAGMLWLDPDPSSRRAARTILAVTGVLTLGEALVNQLYFRSPVPLPFYAKSTGLYGAHMRAVYAGRSLITFVEFFASNAWLFLLVAMDVFWDFRTWRRETVASEKGILVATVLFITYYSFFVLQIMGMQARFYYPAFPAIAFLAARAILRMSARLSARIQQSLDDLPARTAVPVFAIALVWLVPFVLMIGLDDRGRGTRPFRDTGNFQLKALNPWGDAPIFPLDKVAQLPDDFVIATTEVGTLGLENPRKRIVDLAGLNTADFAHPPFSAALLFSRYHPDLIYMPHAHYREMTAQLERDPYFKAHYDYYRAEEAGAFLSVAIWRDSRYYAQMQRMRRVTPGG